MKFFAYVPLFLHIACEHLSPTFYNISEEYKTFYTYIDKCVFTVESIFRYNQSKCDLIILLYYGFHVHFNELDFMYKSTISRF